ncbi:hypothetical protein [Mycolicibacterium gilvum]|uniref:hypothetical protein n=1 Tax=Mycolicibacterium gilvum TaxID=1804 RepID=UPI0040465EA6
MALPEAMGDGADAPEAYFLTFDIGVKAGRGFGGEDGGAEGIRVGGGGGCQVAKGGICATAPATRPVFSALVTITQLRIAVSLSPASGPGKLRIFSKIVWAFCKFAFTDSFV